MSTIGSISTAQAYVPPTPPTPVATVTPPANTAQTGSADTAPVYSAVANVNASTIRGGNLDIVT